jgi:hypothetical protein
MINFKAIAERVVNSTRKKTGAEKGYDLVALGMYYIVSDVVYGIKGK